jgi:hypothetical protein
MFLKTTVFPFPRVCSNYFDFQTFFSAICRKWNKENYVLSKKLRKSFIMQYKNLKVFPLFLNKKEDKWLWKTFFIFSTTVKERLQDRKSWCKFDKFFFQEKKSFNLWTKRTFRRFKMKKNLLRISLSFYFETWFEKID